MCDHCGCRAFAEIAELTRDHERILDLAWRVAETDDAAARAELLPLLADHVVKEELGLYPLLVATGGLDDDVLAALEAEHTTIDRQLQGDGWDRRAFYELAAHIEQEEMELFPAAMFGFDEGEWDELAATFRDVTESTADAAVGTAAAAVTTG
jgi:hemerythrin-like domain-containing protein